MAPAGSDQAGSVTHPGHGHRHRSKAQALNLPSCGPDLVGQSASRSNRLDVHLPGRAPGASGRQIFDKPGMEVAKRSWVPDVDPGPRFCLQGRRETDRALEAFRRKVEGRICPWMAGSPSRWLHRLPAPTRSQQGVRGGCGLRPDGLACAQTNGWS